MKLQQKYDLEELKAYAKEHTTNECAEHYAISYQAMAQLIYRYKLVHKVEQVNNHQRGTRLHWVWRAMNQRCNNPNNKAYKNYGGRGIRVCSAWQGVYGFTNFSEWAVSNGYKEGLTLDRINNNENYCPENCRWVTNGIQALNKRTTVFVTYKGETKPLIQWSRELGVPYSCLQTRHYKGYTDTEIIEGKRQEEV